jgi:hypothetical protein
MHPVERVEHSQCIEARFVVADKVHPSSCALSIDACTFLNFHPLPTSLLTLCESRRSDRRPDLRRRLDALSLCSFAKARARQARRRATVKPSVPSAHLPDCAIAAASVRAAGRLVQHPAARRSSSAAREARGRANRRTPEFLLGGWLLLARISLHVNLHAEGGMAVLELDRNDLADRPATRHAE